MNPIESLKEKARKWGLAVVELHNTPYPPELEPEKQKLLSRAVKIKNGIEKVFGTIDELSPIAKTQELGALPIVVPAVAISGAAAAIAKWYYDYKKVKDRVESYKEFRGSGLSHKQALGVLGETRGFMGNLKNTIIPLAIITSIYILNKRIK